MGKTIMSPHHTTKTAAIALFSVAALYAQTPGSAADSAGLLPMDSAMSRPSAPESEPPKAEAQPVYSEPPTRPFSLFDYGEIISFGVSVDYLYYKEEIDISDEIQSFKDYFGRPPQIQGAPKSTEYGFLIGLHLGGQFYSLENKLWARPEVTALLGFGNTYDGSLQSQLLINGNGDTVGLEYDPYKFNKNNFFVHAGCEVGYTFSNPVAPFALYSGLDFKLWYRNLIDNQGLLYYSTNIANSETYYWLGLPLGVLLTCPVSPKLVLGLDANATFMLTGNMGVTMTSSDGTPINFPNVTLGNRTSLNIALFMEKLLNEQLSIKFSPYLSWYGFGKSNTETASAGSASETFYEPPSSSYLFGATLIWEVLKKRFY